MFGAIFDVEGDSLRPTKLHVLSASYDGENISSTPDYQKMRDFFENEEILVGHNIARWDTVECSRILGIKIQEDTLIVDTLALSWYLFPDRPRHNLESWGETFGVKKPEITDWTDLSYEQYRHRCEEDVRITGLLWKKELNYLRRLYKSEEEIMRFLRYLAFKMDCAVEQERERWKLDLPKARENKAKLERLFEEKEYELRLRMPPVPIVTTYKRPKSLYKRDGELSKAGERWVELARTQGFSPSDRDQTDVITSYSEPNPGSVHQIKEWLFSLGWKPQTFKTNKQGEEIPQINRSKQDGGGVCNSVKSLYEIEPALESLDNYYVLRHRIGILSGFIEDCDQDGYVTARIQGLTNTLRFKHAECVNLPKVDAPYGAEIRGVLIAPEGYELCGSDQSSLEDRTKQHFMFKYDPEYVKEMMTDDFDPHIDIAVIGGLMQKEEAEFYKNFKPEVAHPDGHTRFKLLKTIRGIAKNTNYACVYGAGPPKISKTAGISLEEATTLHSAYWSRNHSVKRVADSLTVKTVLGQKWLFNPVSRFWYSLRHEKDRFSTLNQGSGVFAFDSWVALCRSDRPDLDGQIPKFIGQFHDEIVLCIPRGYREIVTKWLRQKVEQLNDILKLNRSLDIGVEWGETYAEIH